MTAHDRALFDSRPPRPQTCPRCNGCGTIYEGYALAPCDRFEGAPDDALCAIVVGTFDIFTACKEAADLAKRSQRQVAFEFNGQVVVVRGTDNPDVIARAWWQRQHGETPEASFARR